MQMFQTHQLKDKSYQKRCKSEIQLHAVYKKPLENKDSGKFEIMERDIQYNRLPRWRSSKESTCQCRRCKRLQGSCLENSMDRGACQDAVHMITKSQTWLCDWACMYISYKHLPKERWSRQMNFGQRLQNILIQDKKKNSDRDNNHSS